MTSGVRFARFNGVGALGVAVQLATVGALIGWLDVDEMIATAAGVAAAVVHNFVWHYRWTWADRSRGRPFAALSQFALANGLVSLAGNVLIVWGLVATTPVHGVAANAVAIAVCGLVNYWVCDRIVFSGSRLPGSGSRCAAVPGPRGRPGWIHAPRAATRES
jgi:putative flippase GtrA